MNRGNESGGSVSVSVGVGEVPIPSTFYNGFNGLEAGCPAEFSLDFFRRRDESCWVARAAGLF